jgi:excisionase family DNA binding protein
MAYDVAPSEAQRLVSRVPFYMVAEAPANMNSMGFTTGSEVERPIGRSVSLDHAAQLLGVSRRTVYNRIREGRLQTIRTMGGSQRVLLDSVHHFGGGRRPAPAFRDAQDF